MSPIDDELRAALHQRAQVLTLSPDPLAGIESRARRIQRNRVGAAVAGSALAVAAIATVVPAVQSATSGPPRMPQVATSNGPETQRPAPSYALDPRAPWAYRGIPREQLGQGTVETVEREYATRRGASDVTVTPLFGQVYEPSQQVELVFLAQVDGAYRWGVAQSSEAGPEFLWDEALPSPASALAAALPGDEVARLLVVADPRVDELSYGADAGEQFRTMAEVADGVGVIALEGEPATDRYLVFVGGEEIHSAPAPDPKQASAPEQPATSTAALDPEQPWEVRGERSLVTDGQLQALGEDWAQRHGVDASAVEVKPLYVQRSQVGAEVEVVYLVRFRDNPWMWGVSSLGEGGWSWYADNELAPGTAALAAALPGDASAERLLVVAAPSLGGAVYAADGRSYKPMTDQAPGVWLAAIAQGDTDDRYKVLDGDGDLDNPVFEGPAPDFQNAG